GIPSSAVYNMWAPTSPTADQALQMARASCNGTTTPYLGNYDSRGGYWGSAEHSANGYNHVMTPNKSSCGIAGSWGNGGSGAITASSNHPGGVNVLMADGAVRFVNDSVSADVWGALGTIKGGEP